MVKTHTMKYIFGYGSIMNKTSLAKTLPGERSTKPATLFGYQRKMNAPVNGYLYMNLVANEEMSVDGVSVPVTAEELERMGSREAGYRAVDVSRQISLPVDLEVIAFLAPNRSYPDMHIPRSYLETCMRDLPKSIREKWLAETIIENEILEDLEDPVYVNAAFG